MITLHVLYGPPDDPEAFEHYYRTTHAPLADKIPNMSRPLEWGKATTNLGGGESPYFWIATLTFPDNDALQAALASPEGAAAGADVAKFATGGVTMIVSEVN
jgi:uncharacterized protein (TIGR02118 family)